MFTFIFIEFGRHLHLERLTNKNKPLTEACCSLQEKLTKKCSIPVSANVCVCVCVWGDVSMKYVLSVYWGFPLGALVSRPEMCYGLIAISKFSVVCEWVCDCATVP